MLWNLAMSVFYTLWSFMNMPSIHYSYQKVTNKMKNQNTYPHLHNSFKIQWKNSRNRIKMYALTCIYMTTHIHRGNMIWNQVMSVFYTIWPFVSLFNPLQLRKKLRIKWKTKIITLSYQFQIITLSYQFQNPIGNSRNKIKIHTSSMDIHDRHFVVASLRYFNQKRKD